MCDILKFPVYDYGEFRFTMTSCARLAEDMRQKIKAKVVERTGQLPCFEGQAILLNRFP